MNCKRLIFSLNFNSALFNFYVIKRFFPFQYNSDRKNGVDKMA